MKLCVERIDSENALRALKGDWDALLGASASNMLFLTWEWVTTWWQIYGEGNRLYVLVARDETGRVCGIAPLKRSRRGLLGILSVDRVEFIGQGSDVVPDHLDLICAPGHEAEVAARFAEHIASDADVDGVDLRAFAGRSSNLAPFVDELRKRGTIDVGVDSVCPVLPLPATAEAFLASRSKNYKKKIREYEKRCERDLNTRLRRSETPEELRRDMRSLVELHHKRWAGRSRAFRTDQYIAFHERLSTLALAQNWVRLYSLETDSKAIAHLYCFAYDNRFYYYQAGWDPEYSKHRIGLVLMHKVIQEAIRDGAKVFDFLRGKEPYKYRWSSAEAQNMRVVYWKRPAPRVVAALAGVFDSGLSKFDGAPGADDQQEM